MVKQKTGKQNPTSQKGITLIALIITIIVMLILVGVSVTVALDGGLFSTAKNATGKTQLELEKEQLLELAMGAIGDNGKVDTEKLDAAVLADGKFTKTDDRTYKSEKSGNTFTVSDYGSVTVAGNAGDEPEVEPDNVPEALLDYLLGAKDEETGLRLGKDLSTIMDWNYDDYPFENVPEELGELTFISHNKIDCIVENDITYDTNDVYFVQENDEGTQTKYKFRVKIDHDTDEGTTMADMGVKEISYNENTKVGKYVEYDNKNWIIMYDDNVNGLQMISEDALLNENDNYFYLGYNDAIFDEENFDENTITEIDGEEGKSDLEKAMYSYDNMVTRLNNICDELVADAGYIKSVRSVGSSPLNPNNDNPVSFICSAETIGGYGTSTWFENNLNLTKNVVEGRTYYTIGDTRTEYKIKGTDTNSVNDFDRMVALGINSTEKDYWLASRHVSYFADCINFCARYLKYL